ncbi:hypothetical protein D3C81_2054300 [compost metagenome]
MEQKPSSIAPGYCIAQQAGPLAYQAHYLFGGKPSKAADYFLQLNADPRNPNQAVQLAMLMQAKTRTSKAVQAGGGDFPAF